VGNLPVPTILFLRGHSGKPKIFFFAGRPTKHPNFKRRSVSGVAE
jgi:hypothetical protein